MNAYSPDLRERIAQAYDEGAGSQRVLAARFRVSRTFVERLLRRRRETGSLAALPRAGGQRGALDAAALRLIAQLVGKQNDLTLAGLCEHVVRERGLRISVPTMHRAVVRLGPRTKKDAARQ
ncbi:MAG TPA: helix-turn-helix domain-containing protein [Candidatus Binatia bacterium]|nr:helix-turn-helix domain-containing protein [Candidatus Binatia bacterium]